jgi:uncharacterized repeat protein (TIGR03843 family)
VGRGVDQLSSHGVRDDLSERSAEQAAAVLQGGTITASRPVYSGSNGVFLLSISDKAARVRAIYKPRSGESPLWDFPDGTLYRRERAAFLVSEALGWSLVPPTVIRSGPYGVGAVQWFISFDRTVDYGDMLQEHQEELRKIALFDWLTNNGDRKVGHCLVGKNGKVWAIDHGLTFHTDPKLRTVIWDFGGQPVPGSLVGDVRSLRTALSGKSPLSGSLSQLLTDVEVEALSRRLDGILRRPVFPLWSGSYRSVPWPPF